MKFKEWMRYFFAMVAMIVVYYAASDHELNQMNDELNQMTRQLQLDERHYIDELIVYGRSEDELLVPVTVKIDSFEREVEALFDIFTVKSNQLPKGVYSILGPDVTLNDYTLENECLTLDVSASFDDYEDVYGRMLFESLVYSFTSLEGIEMLKFKVNGQLVDSVVGVVSLDDGLTQEMGINLQIQELGPSVTDAVTIYYYKTIQEEEVLVPVTYLVDSSIDPMMFAYEQLKVGSFDDEYYTFLDTLTALVEPMSFEDGQLVLHFNESVYRSYADASISELLLKQIEKTFLSFEQLERLVVLVNGEEVVTFAN